MKPHLSIIIPAFNEEQRIGSTLEDIHDFVAAQMYLIEVIVVDDGSSDRTANIVSSFAHTHDYLRLVRLPTNQGKGAAIRAGMLVSQGMYRLFADADNSTPIAHVKGMIASVETGADVAVGSRHVPGSIIITKQNTVREVLGFMYRVLVRSIAPTGIRDTQNGFKLFKAQTADLLFRELMCPRWAFDVEILRRARQNGLTIVEVPVTWVNDNRSKMRYSHMFLMLLDSVTIAWRTYKL
jgi:glycosyltransferase involved in cell wall biosynthesis